MNTQGSFGGKTMDIISWIKAHFKINVNTQTVTANSEASKAELLQYIQESLSQVNRYLPANTYENLAYEDKERLKNIAVLMLVERRACLEAQGKWRKEIEKAFIAKTLREACIAFVRERDADMPYTWSILDWTAC